MAVQSLKALRRRVRAVKGIKQITRAMEMVSAAKLRRAQATLMAGRPYAAKLRQLLTNLADDPAIARHPLFEAREGGPKILVVFTSDRGLSGSFNANLIRLAETTLREQPEADWRLVCVGRKGRDYFQRRRWPILESHVGLTGQADPALARRIADRLYEEFVAGRCAEVRLAYSNFISTVVYRPTLAKYLPLSVEMIEAAPAAGVPAAGAARRAQVEYIMEPSAAAVLDSLLPRYLASRIYITLAENATSEHSARMIAMNNATKNCSDMIDSLTLQVNKARQAAITKELLEVVSGAEALHG